MFRDFNWHNHIKTIATFYVKNLNSVRKIFLPEETVQPLFPKFYSTRNIVPIFEKLRLPLTFASLVLSKRILIVSYLTQFVLQDLTRLAIENCWRSLLPLHQFHDFWSEVLAYRIPPSQRNTRNSSFMYPFTI